jgi:peptidoglycan/LPS O-acetylase OafA/YrhL
VGPNSSSAVARDTSPDAVREAAPGQAVGIPPSRLAGIEGLRAVAATSILVYHVFIYGAPDGQPVDLGPLDKLLQNFRAGVTLFFVLSGFLLYRVFVKALLRDGTMPAIRSYFRNRLLRIVPAYWVILLGVVLLFEHQLLTAPLQLLANLLFLQNYIPGYIRPEEAAIAPAWSLVIEMSFYAVLPALGLLALWTARRGASRIGATIVPVVLMLIVGVVSKFVARGMESGSDGRWIFEHSLPTHADWFAAGMGVATASVLWEQGRLRLPRAWRSAACATALVLTLVSIKLFYGGSLNALEYQTPIALACALLLAVVVFSQTESLVRRFLTLRAVFFAGLISYSIFLLHDPLVRGLREWELTLAGRGGFLVNLAVISFLTVVLAVLVYIYVERPALARKRRWQPGDLAGLGSTAPPGGGSPDLGSALGLRAVESRSEPG